MNSSERAAFRRRKQWLEFRESFRKEKDALTGSKLSRRFNLHHLDLNPSHYSDLSHRENFVPLNSQSHDFVHWGLCYYKKDPEGFISRMRDIWDKMIELDEFNSKDLF